MLEQKMCMEQPFMSTAVSAEKSGLWLCGLFFWLYS